jgi:23S rRNA pseudouridine2605 synthase
MPDVMRIQRALARAGVASRRKAEELVAARRVLINGETAKTGQTVDIESD